VTALDGIDLEIPARTVFGLLGPNGAGKTTTIRILSTILRPDAGRAEVLGRDVVRQAGQVRTARPFSSSTNRQPASIHTAATKSGR
jgi:ABC-type multidrug transport system ATPase subunit